ncbi:hypothetical protein ACFPFX_03305 [Streptomyces mauvecolor]|uniref:Integral membrane protein n=1 Tax=Streptomyces mauvecolor TaxID=58345 RepID=A0ABV9UFX5_9ACTN
MGSERSAAGRAAWGVGGVALIVLGGVLIWIIQTGGFGQLAEDLSPMGSLAVRSVTFVLIGGGAWCLVRAGKQRA